MHAGCVDCCCVCSLLFGVYVQLGYARLQLLLGYVVPEILDEEAFIEETGDRVHETAETAEEPQPALHVPYRPYSAYLLLFPPDKPRKRRHLAMQLRWRRMHACIHAHLQAVARPRLNRLLSLVHNYILLYLHGVICIGMPVRMLV